MLNYPELTGLSERIIGCCIEVHKQLGPGLLESIYGTCLIREFQLQKIGFRKEVSIPINYKGINLETGYRLDFIIEDSIALELKSVETVLPIHKMQVLTYLKITGLKLGLLINFNVPVLKQGINRVIH